jgi:hypothetical protein
MEAMEELGYTFSHPNEALYAWLDLLCKDGRRPCDRPIKHLCVATAEFCRRLQRSALKKRDAGQAGVFQALAEQFLRLAEKGTADERADSSYAYPFIGYSPSHATAEVTIVRSQFWNDRQTEFERYIEQFAKLEADWNATHERWLLRWGLVQDCFNVPQECKNVFSAIARKAVTDPELHSEGNTVNAEPWQLWLEYMRTRDWRFHAAGSPIACTEREWDDMVKGGKSLAQVRREQRYTTDDEWKKVYRRTKSGKLRRLSATELKAKSSENLKKYYHWLQNGTIARVFEASASLCQDLGARAFELEVVAKKAQPLLQTPMLRDRESGVSVTASEVALPHQERVAKIVQQPRKKRGRPSKIPDELKLRALSVKGGKARAQILYCTSYPTPQQVKNVPTILRHFESRRQTPE